MTFMRFPRELATVCPDEVAAWTAAINEHQRLFDAFMEDADGVTEDDVREAAVRELNAMQAVQRACIVKPERRRDPA